MATECEKAIHEPVRFVRSTAKKRAVANCRTASKVFRFAQPRSDLHTRPCRRLRERHSERDVLSQLIDAEAMDEASRLPAEQRAELFTFFKVEPRAPEKKVNYGVKEKALKSLRRKFG